MKNRFLSLFALLFLLAFPVQRASAAGTKHVFPSFSTGTLQGGGAAFTQVLNVAGLPSTEFMGYSVTADFVPGTAPHDAHSSTMKMKIFDGASTVFAPLVNATSGILPAGGSTSLAWSGVMVHNYTGGTSLSVLFQDPFTDASGPYSSTLSNIVVTIYPLTTPNHTFPGFSTGTIMGGGSAFTTSLDVSSLTIGRQYLFLTVTADYVPANGAWSSSMFMTLGNGSTKVHWASSAATIGSDNTGASATLAWTGVMARTYVAGDPLVLTFQDSYGDGTTYQSSLSNVTVTISPTALPIETFSAFSSGTVTGGGAAVSTSVNVSALPAVDYLCYRVTADYVPLGPNEGWSSTMTMALDDGGATTFKAYSGGSGQLPGAGATTLTWTGLLSRPYAGGGPLKVSFKDGFTDASGPYTSRLDNVVLTLYPVQDFPTLVTLASFLAHPGANTVSLAWTTGFERDTAGFNIWRSTQADGDYEKLNAALVPSTGSGMGGASYTWADTAVAPGQRWFYKLEDLNTTGEGTFHGPVSATLDPASRILAFQASPLDIFKGGSALLSWTVTGNPQLAIQGLGPVTGGSLRVAPLVTTPYLLTDGQGAENLVTVTVRPFQLRDMAGLSRAWGSSKGMPAYDPAYDPNGDGQIDDTDVVILLK